MKGRTVLYVAIVILLILNGIFLLLDYGKGTSRQQEGRSDAILGVAGTLKSEGLNAQAADLYRRILLDNSLPLAVRGNVAYLLAEMELDKLDAPGDAYAHYLIAEKWCADADLLKKIRKGKVEALERGGRTFAAKSALGEGAALIPENPTGGKVVARIGKRKITEEEVRAALDSLPLAMKKSFEGKAGFASYVRQYVASQLLVQAARRAGLEKESSVKERLAMIKDEVMKNAYLEKELAGKLTVDDLEARNFYKSHLDQFSTGKGKPPKPYEEVRESCLNAVRQSKEQSAVNQILQRLMQAEDVEFDESKK